MLVYVLSFPFALGRGLGKADPSVPSNCGPAWRSRYSKSLRAEGFVDRIPVADRSKARVCGRSFSGVAGSNPAGDMDVCVACCR